VEWPTVVQQAVEQLGKVKKVKEKVKGR